MNRKRITSILKWTGIVIVSLAVIYAVLLIWSTIKLSQAYAALAKDGRPMRAEDVIPPKVPDTENAALLYQIAILRLKAERAGEQNLLEHEGKLSSDLLSGSLDPNEQEELARLLQTTCIEQALAAVEEGVQRSQCRFDLDYDKGPGTRLVHLAWIGNTTRILCAKAQMEASQGNGAKAWKTLETALRFADALRSEPFPVSQNVRIAQTRKTIASMQSLCQISPPDPQQMARLDNVLKGFDDDGPYIAAMDGERLLCGDWVFRASPMSRFNWAFSSDHCVDWFGLVRSLARTSPVLFKPTLQYDHAVYLEVLHQSTQMLVTPYSPQDTDVERQLFAAIPWYCPLTRNLLSPISKSYWIVGPKAEIRITRAGLAALRYRQAHGVFPENFDALGLQDLVDPFNGKPLFYRSEGEGFLVYSVGLDQKDDGGTPRPNDKEDPRYKEGWDIVWRYPGPKAL